MKKYDGREFLKEHIRDMVDFSTSDQSLGVEMPKVDKKIPEGAELIKLAAPKIETESKKSFLDMLNGRASRRKYLDSPITMDELSYLLYATNGIRDKSVGAKIVRTAPSAGNRHPIETNLLIFNVEGLEPGLYRYNALEHGIYMVDTTGNLKERLAMAVHKYAFVANAPLVFVWSAIPYRSEWRFKEASYKFIALDAGHIAENLYLTCEVLGLGTCSIGVYDQDLVDELIEVDGEEEFTVYINPVGRI